MRGSIIDVISASPWTRDKLAEFQSALQWASDNFESDPDAAVEHIAEVDPSFGAVLTTFLASPYAPLVYFLITTALSLCMWLIPQAPDAPANDPLPITPQQINQFFINAPNLDVQLPDPSGPSPIGSPTPPPPEPPEEPPPPPATESPG